MLDSIATQYILTESKLDNGSILLILDFVLISSIECNHTVGELLAYVCDQICVFLC